MGPAHPDRRIRDGAACGQRYFGGASAATEADVQLFWGEPLDGVAERIERLEELGEKLGREHAPLEYGLRVTTVVRDSTDRAWADAEAKVERMANGSIARTSDWSAATGQQRLFDLAARGDVLDDKYRALGISHFVLSDTPYLPEIERQGDQLLPLLRQ
ncbi:LLM class flavin-dependent oxidoreductase [Amycolatopsis sp. lyj-109]|uniref:LLM class flavin-dependent oxidoreductase n=1 Tax=Amycolatopsis sp. lyj-109 TaxID=2789287 RepID=UPI00397D39C4